MPLAGTLLQWFHWALGLSYTVAPADARAATTVMDDPTEALHLAADDADLEGLRRALSAGEFVDDDDMDYDRTPLGWLCYGASPHDEARRIACAELLLAAGANIEATDCYGDTPLIIAVYAPSKDCPRLVQYLLDAGANPNAIGDGGWTPLHYASENGFVEVANLLIKHGAAVNAKATCERAGGPSNHPPLIVKSIRWRVTFVALIGEDLGGVTPGTPPARMTLSSCASNGRGACYR